MNEINIFIIKKNIEKLWCNQNKFYMYNQENMN